MLNTIMNAYVNEISNWLSAHKSTTLPAWLKRNPQIRNQIELETAQYNPKNIMESVYILINGYPDQCDCGNKPQFNTFELGYRKGCHLGNQCKSVRKSRLDNQKKTIIERYGVDTTGKIPGVNEKRQDTMLTKYGVCYAMQSQQLNEKRKQADLKKTKEDWHIVNQKRKQTSLERYGVDHHMKTAESKSKQKKTNLTKYGVESPTQNDLIKQKIIKTHQQKTQKEKLQIQEKTKRTLLDKYGVDAGSRIGIEQQVLDILSNSDQFRKTVQGQTRKQVSEQLGIAPHTLYVYSKKYNASDLFEKPEVSEFEREVCNYVSSNELAVEMGNRTIVAPKELDIFVPQKNLAIECCGLYWHAEKSSNRGKEYHMSKHMACAKQGITLITLFEDEWRFNQTRVKSRLDHLLGNHRSSVAARKCTIRILTSQETQQFISCNHLQGHVNATVNLGLEHQGQLVAAMTFRRPRFNAKYQWEILRFCTAGHVAGAAGKLFSYFLKTHNPASVISYSDNRWGNGSVYSKLGFEKVSESVGYYYTDYKRRYDRVSFQKHKLPAILETYDEKQTEWENMQANGYDRIWNCGQSLWVYINNSNGDNK